MGPEWNFWDTPWAFYFEGYIWLPFLVRLLLLSGPVLIGTRRHGHHLRWFWKRLLEFPRGKPIALNIILGIAVPLVVGLTIRFSVPPFGSGWDKWSYSMAVIFLIFLGVHFVWDLRRVLKARHLAQKVIAVDLDRYHGY